MTTQEKTNSDDKERKRFDFPCADPERMKEMMKTWCASGKGFPNCCPMANAANQEESK